MANVLIARVPDYPTGKFPAAFAPGALFAWELFLVGTKDARCACDLALDAHGGVENPQRGHSVVTRRGAQEDYTFAIGRNSKTPWRTKRKTAGACFLAWKRNGWGAHLRATIQQRRLDEIEREVGVDRDVEGGRPVLPQAVPGGRPDHRGIIGAHRSRRYESDAAVLSAHLFYPLTK